jgi:hypothetical protein
MFTLCPSHIKVSCKKTITTQSRPPSEVKEKKSQNKSTPPRKKKHFLKEKKALGLKHDKYALYQ